jgi:drug/metabolite transporter (DMT)-like permease
VSAPESPGWTSALLDRVPPAVRGGLLMAAMSALIATDTTIVRVVTQELHPAVVVFIRSFFSLVLFLPWVMRSGVAGLHTTKLTVHVLRAALKVAALILFFLAISLLPLAEVTAIGFGMPLFAAAGAVLFLGERVTAGRAAAIACGFAGILVILRPGVAVLSAGAFAAVGSALLLGGVGLMVKYLARYDSPNTIVLLNLALTTLLALPVALLFWSTPSAAALGWLALMGALAALAQFCFTHAMRLADASQLMPVDFLRLPFVAIIAFAVYGEVPDLWVWAGAAVIFASTFGLLRSGRRLAVEAAGRAG